MQVGHLFVFVKRLPTRRSGILHAVSPDIPQALRDIEHNESTAEEPVRPAGESVFGSRVVSCARQSCWLWPFNLPIARVLWAVLYGALRGLRALNRLNHPAIAQHRSMNAHAEQPDRASY
jgi:hypothetical protein